MPPHPHAHIFNSFTTSSFGHKKLTSDGILRGTLSEPVILKAVETLFEGNIHFSLGVLHSKAVRYLVASPDAVGVFKGHVTAIEVKCSKSYTLRGKQALLNVIDVVAGSDEYLQHVPHEYLSQLLTEATVLDVNYVLLVLAHSEGLSKLIRIEYPPALRQEYVQYLKNPIFEDMFGWLKDLGNSQVSDADFAANIPSWSSEEAKRLWRTNLYLLRAVYKYRLRIGRPIKPTHVFRDYVNHFYDLWKGGTDTECKQVVRATKGNSSILPFRQRFTHRLLYFPVIAALRLVALSKAVRKFGGDLDKITIKQFRRELSKVPFNDSLWEFGEQLRDSRPCLGELALAGANKALQLKTPTAQLKKTKKKNVTVTGAVPTMLQVHIEARAERANMDVDVRQFFPQTWIPIADSLFSPTTPGMTILRPEHMGRFVALERIFKSRPVETPRNRERRLDFWVTEGFAVRASPAILHLKARRELEKGERKTCFWCARLCTEMYTCAFCGEDLCAKCWDDFHSTAMETPPAPDRDTAESEASCDTQVFEHDSGNGKTKKLKFAVDPVRYSSGASTTTPSRGNDHEDAD